MGFSIVDFPLNFTNNIIVFIGRLYCLTFECISTSLKFCIISSGHTLDFNAQHSVNGSIDIAELHLVAASIGLPLDVPHHQVGVAFSVFNDHIF